MRFVILHYHIFKNAGTTIQEILDRNFGERFFRLDTPHRDGRISNAELVSFLDANPHIEAISSHQIRHPVPAAPGFLFFDICFLRDPFDRIRSIYDYARDKPDEGDPISDLANSLPLDQFVEHLLTNMPHWLSDVQVHLLGDGDLDRATEAAMGTAFLGVVDCFDQSVIAGRHLLDPVFPNLDCDEPPVNVSKGFEGSLAARRQSFKQACGPRLFAELLNRNRLDLELVERARREVGRRLNLAK